MHVEAGPDAGGAGFGGHGGGESFAFGFKRLSGFHEQRTALAGTHGGPGREGLGGGFYGSFCIFYRGGGGTRGHALVQRVAALEGGTVGGGTRGATNQHLNIDHGVFLKKIILGSASPTVCQNGPSMPRRR